MSCENRIADMRKFRGLSQAKLAKLLGVAQNTVSNWENGTREPDNETLKKLAFHLDCTVDYLLGLDNTSPKLEAKMTSSQLVQALKQDPHAMQMVFKAFAKALASELEEGEELVKGVIVGYPQTNDPKAKPESAWFNFTQQENGPDSSDK